MHFQHILADDITMADAELLDKARRQGYDAITPSELAKLIMNRDIDVWRLEPAPHVIIATTFVMDLGGRALDVNYAFGARGSLPELEEAKAAVWELADRLSCYKVTMATSRPLWAKLLGAEEVTRIYSIPRPRS